MRRPLRSDTARALSNLAIELGDPGRMARARRLHRAGSVGEIAVHAEVLTTEVFGSRGDPYDVTIRLAKNPLLDGSVPDPQSITTQCTCPDGLLGAVCKHALAALLTFAEEVEADSRLLDIFVGTEDKASPVPVASPMTDNPFFDPPQPIPASFERFESMLPAENPSMVVDGTDAWPVISDAIATITRALR